MRILLDRRRFCRFIVGWLAIRNLPEALANDESDDPLVVRIQRKAVESSSIASVGFHAGTQVLEIEFHSGALYRYLAVPPAVFEAFQTAESKGRFFSQSIRGKYRFRRLAEAKPRG